MDQMMNGMMHGPMMWAMGLLWLLVFVALILAIAALAKYLFSGRKQ
jgi:hypothetical protein